MAYLKYVHDLLGNRCYCSCIVQLRPAVAVTALSSLHSRNLLGFGCEYGFILCDLRTQSTLIRNCLLSAEGLSALFAFISLQMS